VRPHYYCLPVLKRETHRLALVQAATSGSPKFFLGTDSAPHAAHLKEARHRLRRLLQRPRRHRDVCRGV
jgi:dihydroorotase